jgi:hypothetical protein
LEQLGGLSLADLDKEFPWSEALSPEGRAKLSRKLTRLSTESGDDISLQLLRRLTRTCSVDEDSGESEDTMDLDLKDKVFTQDYAKKLARGGAMQSDPLKQ